MNTNITQKPIDSLSLFPPNMRLDPLFLIFSDILDKGIEQYYTEQTNSVENIYNPSNPYYDPNYIISLLGGAEVAELLSEDIDKKAIAMIYPDLIKQRGKEVAIETILKLLKINYKNLELLRDRDGCVWLTVIIKDGYRINEPDLIKFEKLSKKFLPMCVRLRSVTNCFNVGNSTYIPDSKWDFDIGEHTLDNNIRLDSSRQDTHHGYAIPNSDLIAKICTKEYHLVDMEYKIISSDARTQSFKHYVDCSQAISYQVDRRFKVDFNNHIGIREAYLI